MNDLLENESLTADLDDTAAKELLNWESAGAEQVVEGTATLSDEDVEEGV